MIPLSRREEQVLLAVWNLKDDAFLLSVMKYLTQLTESEWSLGAVQKPLLQLERKGYITTTLGGATQKRGGRRKKLCSVTKQGIDALITLKKEQEAHWEVFLENVIKS